jgi:assimilatory nitrate reductase catalytic subunit
VADLTAVARMLAGAERAIILTARGAEQHSKGTDTRLGLDQPGARAGAARTTGSGYGCLTGQGNGQGGREHGQKADQLPGYRRIDDPAARAHVAGVWGVDPDSLPGPGVSATELLERLGGPTVRGAAGVRLEPGRLGAPGRTVERRLAGLDLLVVADFVLSETAALADVVLPAAQWAEEDGTMTNLEGRVLRRRSLRPPPANVRSDLDILTELTRRLGGPAFPVGPRATFDELRQASAGARRLRRHDVGPHRGGRWLFWPCPTPEHPGTPGCSPTAFATPDGRARFVAVEHRPPAESPDEAYPFLLTTGRVLAQYQSGRRRGGSEALNRAAPDASSSCTRPGGATVHRGRRPGPGGDPTRHDRGTGPGGRLDPADTLFVPFHWGGAARANSATSDALDPTSRMPEFKVCAARLERAS